MGQDLPVWRDEHTEIVKQLEKDIEATPRSKWIRYPSYSAYAKALYDKSS